MFFDATQVAPSTGEYEPIPNGRYLVQVVEGETKETSEGRGTGVSIKFQVADGEHQGHTFFQFFNIAHPNETAQRIGQGEFSALCHAVNVLQPKSVEDFKARPFYADVKMEGPRKGKDGKEYGPSNKIAKYYRADGSDLKGSAPAPSTAAAPAKKSAPSWVTGAKAA